MRQPQSLSARPASWPAMVFVSRGPPRAAFRAMKRASDAVRFLFPIGSRRSLRNHVENTTSYQSRAAVLGGRDGSGAGAGHTRRQICARQGARLPDRDPGAGAPADDAAPARRGRRAQHRLLSSRAIAARLWAGSTRRCGVRGALSKRTTSAFSRRSTRSWAPPRYGAASSSTCSRAPNTTASLRCGTPRGRVWTAAATR